MTSLRRVVNSSTRSVIPNRMVLNQDKITEKVKYSMTTSILVSCCYMFSMPSYQAQSRPCRTPIPTPPLFKHNHAPSTAFS